MPATISAPTSKILYKLMEKYQLDSEKIYQSVGINKKDLTDPQKRIPYHTLHKLWSLASERITDPCFGLKSVEIWHPSDLNALGYAWLTSSTLRTALDRLHRYLKVATEFYQLNLKQTAQGYELIFDFKDKKTLNTAQADASMAIVMEMCRTNLDKKLSPLSVSLTHSAPDCQSDYYSYYGCPVHFSQPVNTIVLPINAIDTPLFNSDPYLALINDKAITYYLQKLNDDNIVHQVKKAITEQLTSGVSSEKIATSLNLTERTINRYLKDSGMSFKEILKEVRLSLSKLYIKNGQYSITEIAFQLGFSESSSFSRAFKHWTGTSPADYKKKQSY